MVLLDDPTGTVVQGHYHQSDWILYVMKPGMAMTMMSRNYIQDLISNELYESIMFTVQSHDKGPILYVAIVQDMPQIGSVAARIIMASHLITLALATLSFE